MPTIPDLAQRNNEYPDAPPATDINPAQFGRDAAAMAAFGGEVAQFGNKLVAARKQAMESDAVANAKTEDTIALDKEVDQIKLTHDPNSAESAAEGLRSRMNEMMEKRIKQMPTGDAQRMYRDRMSATMESRYLETLRWENQSRARIQLENLGVRADKSSSDILNNPTLPRTVEHIKDFEMDLQSKAGVSVEAADVPIIMNKAGGRLASSFYNGLAAQAEAASPEKRMEILQMGRAMLKNPPPELAPYLSGEDIRVLEGRFDTAEREGRENDRYMEQLERKAKEERAGKTMEVIQQNIYEGKSSRKQILSNPDLNYSQKKDLLGVLEARLREPKSPNQDALREVVGRIYADNDDPMKIRSEQQVNHLYVKGKLTWEQKSKAIGELRNMSSVGGQVESEMKRQLLRVAEAELAKPDSRGIVDPDGKENLAKFTSFMLTEIEKRKEEGKPIRELLDANNPNSLYKQLQSYKKTPQQVMKSTVEKLKNQAAAPKPPEAPKGMVEVISPSGQRGFIPEANLQKALNAKQPYRLARPSKGRSPQSVGEPKFVNPSTGEAYPEPESEEKLGPSFDQESIDEEKLEMSFDESAIWEIAKSDTMPHEKKIEALLDFSREMDEFDPNSPNSGITPKDYNEMRKELDKELSLLQGDEDALARMPRGRTDAEEADIRNRLKAARERNRNSKIDQRKK